MRERLRLVVRGAVQGVGFRPFVYRMAHQHALAGWCRNASIGVVIEAEGQRRALEAFRLALEQQAPPHAAIHGVETSWLDATGLPPFHIRESADDGAPTAVVMPDIALCEACRGELLDPSNRRYRYPFINCTNCGPRFSIMHALPYDRASTSMRGFPMCPACRREYEDPRDRRFHAEPIACPVCGPQVALWDAARRVVAERDTALVAAATAIRAGRIVALKGLGGFQLLVDAANDEAVRRLRDRKRRDEKPFALMYPDLDQLRLHARVTDVEAGVLRSSAAPIVLLDARDDLGGAVAPAVAPGMRQLGVMLPYSPLHLLLLRDLGRPVVATSGNRAEEPICTDEHDAVARLGDIADVFLVHDRPIVRYVDDSVVRVMRGRELVLRRARGYAPLALPLDSGGRCVLGLGGHLKNTVALTTGQALVVSQHVGDLESVRTVEALHTTIDDLERLYRVSPEAVAVDLHSDYASTGIGRRLGLPAVAVQHHYAHLLACMVDNDLQGPVLGAVWDGVGLGTDGTVWGGEFLRTNDEGFERVACLRPFRLPGGERAVREPRRSALGLLAARGDGALARWFALAPAAFDRVERKVLCQAAERGLNAPVTSSAGRLLDAVAAIAGLSYRMRFEGQAAMLLEQQVDASIADGYAITLTAPDRLPRLGAWAPPALVADWAPLVDALLDDVAAGVPVPVMAARVHNALATLVVDVAVRVSASRMLLTGGCFQNRYLADTAITRLERAGVRAYWHQRLPPNDGGIAAGQVLAALRMPPARLDTRAPGAQASRPRAAALVDA